MSRKHILLCLLLLIPFVVEAQWTDHPTYPYGGTPDTNKGLFVTLLNFKGDVNFDTAQFYSKAEFSDARFYGSASFRGAWFGSYVDFRAAYFSNSADFSRAIFTERSQFNYATMQSIDFRGAFSRTYLDFEGASVKGTMQLGSRRPFMIDLTLLNASECTVEVSDEVQLKMPERKIEKLSLPGSISYFAKQKIIDNLKEKSFGGSKTAAFELDYLLAKSTMYQDKTDVFEEPKLYEVWKWPTWAFAWFYNATMGFGYRPFRIIWWALGIIVAGTIFCFVRMRTRINEYVAETFPKRKQGVSFNTFESLVNCAYFTVSLFFTFRLKGDLLTFFDAKEKKFIITEWLLGLAVYVAFLYHTSAVLQNIRSLFVG